MQPGGVPPSPALGPTGLPGQAASGSQQRSVLPGWRHPGPAPSTALCCSLAWRTFRDLARQLWPPPISRSLSWWSPAQVTTCPSGSDLQSSHCTLGEAFEDLDWETEKGLEAVACDTEGFLPPKVMVRTDWPLGFSSQSGQGGPLALGTRLSVSGIHAATGAAQEGGSGFSLGSPGGCLGGVSTAGLGGSPHRGSCRPSA